MSSTLHELASERVAARGAIESLRMSPVMFELGARPHPPRDLYRAYLAQSDIFLGIYWQSYGWVAPSMDISGLEDEWRLSGGKPRLVYIKHPADARDPALDTLLATIGSSDSVAYQRFETPEQLAELVANDLAVLLSERFTSVEDTAMPDHPAVAAPRALPPVRGRIVGRADDLTRLERDLVDRTVRLLSLTGAGGTGKTRLAVEVGRRAARFFDDGACYAALAEISDVSAVPHQLARALGLQDSGRQPIEDTIVEYLSDKDMLLVVDNFEHVLDAAPLLSRIVDAAPGVSAIVTSRSPLRLSIETEYPVEPLSHPRGESRSPEALLSFPSVELFVDRARQANPSLEFDDDQIAAVGEITRVLDGLPLAIELAAARTRLHDPRTIARHMGSALDLTGRGPRDLPERQQTMRAAIAWSEDLLGEQERRLFRRMAAFNGDATLEAVQQVATFEGEAPVPVLDAVEALVDVGLLRTSAARGGERRLSMLRTVADFAAERLADSGERSAAERRHAEYYLEAAEEASPYLWLPGREPWIEHLATEWDNLRAAVERLVAHDRGSPILWRLLAAVGPYLTFQEPAAEGLRLVAGLELTADSPPPAGVDPITHGLVLRDVANLLTFVGDFEEAMPMLRRAIGLLDEAGDEVGAARGLSNLGVASITIGDPQALTILETGLRRGRDLGDLFSATVAATFLAEVSLALGDIDAAEGHLRTATEMSEGDRLLEGLAALQRSNLAIATDDVEGALVSSAASLRRLESVQASVVGWPTIGLGYCHLRTGQCDVAAKYFDEANRFGRRVGDKSIVAMALVGTAGVAALRGEVDTAARLLGASDTLRKSLDYRMWSSGLALYRFVEETLASSAPADAIETGRRFGEMLSYEEALSLATL